MGRKNEVLTHLPRTINLFGKQGTCLIHTCLLFPKSCYVDTLTNQPISNHLCCLDIQIVYGSGLAKDLIWNRYIYGLHAATIHAHNFNSGLLEARSCSDLLLLLLAWFTWPSGSAFRSRGLCQIPYSHSIFNEKKYLYHKFGKEHHYLVVSNWIELKLHWI